MVVLGRGGAGKSTFCRRLAIATGVPAIELDAHYWDDTLTPLSHEEWIRRQRALLAGEHWIADGDLGPYDVLAARLDLATHVLVLDPPLWLCCLRALRRGGGNLAFWRWTVTWRRREWPRIMRDILASPAHPEVVIVRSRREVDEALHAVWPET